MSSPTPAPLNRVSELEAVIASHYAQLNRVAFRILHDPDKAADAVQEALTSAWKALPRFKGESSLYSWLMRITVNAALYSRRKNLRYVPWPTVSDDSGATHPAELGSFLPSCPIEASELWAMVDRLIPSRRNAIYAWLGHDKLESPNSPAVKSHIHRGIQDLRKMMKNPPSA